MGRLTKAQRDALAFLAERQFASPAEIGYAICPVRPSGYALKAQGAGRLGGGSASRLVKLGFVRNASSERGGFAAYAITPEGRAALRSQSTEVK